MVAPQNSQQNSQPPFNPQFPNTSGINVNLQDTKPDTDAQKYFSDEEVLKLPLTIGLCGWVKHVDEIETPKLLGKKGKVEYDVYYAPPEDIRAMYVNRICNEFCVDYMFNTVYPLITRITQSSNMTELQIFREWRAKLTTIGDALNDNISDPSYYCYDCQKRVDRYHADITSDRKIESKLDGYNPKTKLPIYKYTDIKSTKKIHRVESFVNTFDIQENYIADIITDIGLYSSITSKARKGFFIREIRETFLTTVQNQPQLQEFKNQIAGQQRSGGIIGNAFRGFSGEQ